MPLTRHFYELDEVEAALAYSIIERRQLEACFYLSELIDSDEIMRGFSIMIEVYLIRFGTKYITWLLYVYDICKGYVEVDAGSALSLCCTLCSFKETDLTFLSTLIVNTQDRLKDVPPETIKDDEIVAHSVYVKPIHRYLMRTIRCGNIRCAFWIARHCEEGAVIEILNSFIRPETRKAMESLRTLHEWSGLNYSSSAQLLLCIMMISQVNKIEPIELTIPPIIERNIKDWQALVGRRLRRIYSIPKDCLYMSTRRGLLERPASTMKDLHQLGIDVITTYKLTEGCTFWNNLWRTFGISEDNYEEIDSIMFKDDIPDEWSLEDRLKSHDEGLINPGERLWWRRWLRRYLDSLLLHNDCKVAIEKIEITCSRVTPLTISECIRQLESMNLGIMPDIDELYPRSKNEILPQFGQMKL
jgi:hypothetical protein